MKTFRQIVEETRSRVRECFPWDVADRIRENTGILLLDVREECEYAAFHIRDSLLVPRGILETACEAEYHDAIPELIEAREREVVVICRSGNRSVMAAETLDRLGYRNVVSMKTGLRGWNDYELPLVNGRGESVHPDRVEALIDVAFSTARLGGG